MTKKIKDKSHSVPRRKTATPFKVVDIQSELTNDQCIVETKPIAKGVIAKESKPKKSKGKISKESKSKKSEGKITKESKSKNTKPIKLLVDDDLDLKDLTNDESFSDAPENDSGEEGDYQSFMEEMAKLDGKKKKIISERSEGAGEVSEFNLSTRKGDKVSLDGLLSALDGSDKDASNTTPDLRTLSKRLVGDKGEDELQVPLERPAAERVTRAAGYVGVKKEISVWDAVVHSRRAADQVSFPLNKPDLKLQTVGQAVKERFKSETPLEQQIAALLAGSKAVVKEGEEFSEIELKGLQGLTAREAAERKAELAKMRALQTYQEAKYRRQGKIKSKKYRKIARKEKSKEQLAELEELAKTDPEAAAEQLADLEKSRITERASLKHRNASKYLQDTAKRAKFDKASKQSLNDQLNHHRELLTKHGEAFDDTVEEELDNKSSDINMDCKILQTKDESFQEFSSGYKKYWENEQKRKESDHQERMDEAFEDAEIKLKKKTLADIEALKNANNSSQTKEVDHVDESQNPDEIIPIDSLNYKVKPDGDQSLVSISETLNHQIAKNEDKTSLPNVDPENFLTVEPKKIGGSDLPEIVGYNENDNNEEDEDQTDIIAEAFADDDVLESFKAEKAALVESKKPKDIDLTLPGWGEWGGGGAKPSKRKRKRFTIKAPPQHKRRDENKGHLILNIEKDTKLREHQVSRVPFPFTSVSDFEASVRAPVGSTFIPRTAHLKMVKPRVKTRAGEVIEPMNREQLVKRGIVTVNGGGGLE